MRIDEIGIDTLQGICTSIARQIPCHISIMDSEGRIVASSLPERIGQRHKGAVRVISGEVDRLEVSAEMACTDRVILEGCNLPIELHGERIANVGVAAPLELSRHYAAIAKSCIEALLESSENRSRYQWSEKRFGDFADIAADWFWETDEKQRFTYLSGRVFEVMGLLPREIIGRTRQDIYRKNPILQTPEWRSYMDRLAQQLPFNDLEIPWQRPDGEMRQISISGRPRYDHQGDFVGYRGAGRDISKRKRAEVEALQLRNLLSNIIDSMPSVLIGLDRDACVTQWNAEAERISGLVAQQAIGRPLPELIPRLANDMGLIKAAIKSGQRQSCGKRRCLVSEELRYEDLTVYPLVGEDVEGVVLRVDDVTERVRLEDMMIQSEKMLSVGGLAAGMAHEINNPLAGIIQSVNVMVNRLSNLDLPANIRAAENFGIKLEDIHAYMVERGILELAGQVKQTGRRMSETVENMLSFARKGDASSSHDLSELMDKTLQLAANDYDLKKQYDFKTVAIAREYADDLPLVICEGAKIQQVFLNILRNGAQAMQSSGVDHPKFTIRTRYDQTKQMASVEIEDNGPGISDQMLKRVFEPFYTTKPVGIGTGLGLSVSYFIVTENHGGEMTVRSEPGRGACFTISLPLKSPE